VFLSPKSLALCCAVVLFAGCGDAKKTTPTEGAFGQITARPSTNIARAQPPAAPVLDGVPVLTILQTELSPAILLQTDEREISVFTGLEQTGRAAPSYAALSTRGGPRPFRNGERLDPAAMEENWVMVWFSGARGWTNGDVPWVVYLQHRPRSIRLDTNGLHFRFENRAGSIALLPLYGSYVCPTNETKSAVKFGGKPVQTWRWGEVLHREPLMRVRYWASALQNFPYYCDQTFSIDRSTDTLTIRQTTAFEITIDDWSTKSLMLQPISPTLALASRDQSFPVKFSRRVMDLEMPTGDGPYMTAESGQPLDVKFHVLQHINEGPADSKTNAVDVKERGSWSRWQPPADKRDDCIAMARNAYRANDPDGYTYACYLFTRSLTHHYFNQLFTNYARTFQASARPASPVIMQPAGLRLVPSGPPSPFVPGIEREVPQPGEPLCAAVITAEGGWPQLALRGTGLRFGSITVGNTVPKHSVRLWHSPTTERIVVIR
jgi:hypothetical protein